MNPLSCLAGLLAEVSILYHPGIEPGDLQQLVIVVVHHAAPEYHQSDQICLGSSPAIITLSLVTISNYGTGTSRKR